MGYCRATFALEPPTVLHVTGQPFHSPFLGSSSRELSRKSEGYISVTVIENAEYLPKAFVQSPLPAPVRGVLSFGLLCGFTSGV